MRTRIRGGVVIAVIAALAAGAGFAVAVVAFNTHKTRRVVVSRIDTIVVTAGRPPSLRRRAPLPTVLSGGFQPHSLELQDTVPADAKVLDAVYIPAAAPFRPELAVTWRRDFGSGHPFPDFGLVVWERVPGLVAAWRRAYTWTKTTKLTEVEGIGISLGDFTGDGHADVLLGEDTDGSAGGAYYRAIALFPSGGREVWQQSTSMDDGSIALGSDAIVVTQGRDRYDRGIHCCFRKVRIAWLRWNGHRMAAVKAFVRKNRRGWPPG